MKMLKIISSYTFIAIVLLGLMSIENINDMSFEILAISVFSMILFFTLTLLFIDKKSSNPISLKQILTSSVISSIIGILIFSFYKIQLYSSNIIIDGTPLKNKHEELTVYISLYIVGVILITFTINLILSVVFRKTKMMMSK